MEWLVYDHDKTAVTSGTLALSLNKASGPNFSLKIKGYEGSDSGAAQEFAKEPHIVCHINEDGWKTLLSLSGANSIRIRTSSLYPGTRVVFADKNKDDVYVFYLNRPHSAMSPEDWEAILSRDDLTYQVTEIAQGRGDLEIRKYFSMLQPPHLLPALSILCQGYLLAKTVKQPDKNSNITEALSEMGYTDEFTESEANKSILKMINREKCSTIVEDIEIYWRAPFGENLNLELFTEEWKSLNGVADAPLNGSVSILLGWIISGDETKVKEAGLDSIVAQAYLALAEKLREHS